MPLIIRFAAAALTGWGHLTWTGQSLGRRAPAPSASRRTP